jgi:hypothetical protein
MQNTHRRVVTGNLNGKSVVQSDERLPAYAFEGYEHTLFWVNPTTPDLNREQTFDRYRYAACRDWRTTSKKTIPGCTRQTRWITPWCGRARCGLNSMTARPFNSYVVMWSYRTGLVTPGAIRGQTCDDVVFLERRKRAMN